MPSCPQCNKPLAEVTRQCPTCRADLDLLVDYVSGLAGSLHRAEQLTRAGELGPAVWAYLEVLEVDPDNPVARKQVGQIATAVRQFDRTVPGRRWAQGLPPSPDEEAVPWIAWLKRLVFVALVLAAFAVGFMCATGLSGNDAKPADTQNLDTQKPDVPKFQGFNNQLGGN
jgi:hypothetical protein